MKNMLFESGKAFGFDAEKVRGLLKRDLMPIVASDDLPSKAVTQICALIRIVASSLRLSLLR